MSKGVIQISKIAIITGITGQDGAYLSRLLLEKGYVVHGVVPRCEVDNKERLSQILDNNNLYLHDGDLLDGGRLQYLLSSIMPDEVYNLAAQSHVGVSFNIPEYTGNVNALGVLRLLEIIRNLKKEIRFYQASSSELFGNSPAPQNEKTLMQPLSPYAISKHFAFQTVKMYREAYGLHASNGILFNHESPIRGEDFVTRKVTKAVAETVLGQRKTLQLGNLSAERDWGYAQDYVYGMWLMLQQEQADDYVLATGQMHSVRELVEIAFEAINVSIIWDGSGLEEKGIHKDTGEILIAVDPKLYRPNEVHKLCGDATKANKILGWAPQIDFKSMVSDMVHTDMQSLETSLGGKKDKRLQHAA